MANDIANANGELKLTKNYRYDSSKDSSYKNGITIDKQITINGRGFIINGDNNARAFQVLNNNVILRNIEFTNCSVSGSGSISGYGGAVYWTGVNGSLFDCNFINCYSKHSGSSSISNSGGAVYWSGNNGSLFDCSFVDCYSSSSSSATSLSYTSSSYGGAVYWNGNNGNLFDCNFTDSSSHSSPVILTSSSDSTGSSSSSKSIYAGAIYWQGTDGNILNSSFINCHVPNEGFAHAVFWYGDGGDLLNCSFMNCNSGSSSSSGYNGSVYWYGTDGNMVNCGFNGNYYDYEKYCIKRSTSIIHPVILLYSSGLDNDARKVIFDSTQLVNNISVELYDVTDRKILYDNFTISSEDLSTSYNVNNIDEGEYQIYLYYAGDKFYSSHAINGFFEIFENPSCEVTISEDIVEGDNATINLTLNDDATGSVRLTLSNYTFINELADGKTSFVIPNVSCGINNYKIKYAGDDNYNPVYIDDAFIVLCNSKICLNLKEDYTIDENISLNYTITPNCTGIISIFVDNVFNANISVGDAFEFEDIDVGVHNITVIYNGDEYYSACNDSTIITVSKVTPSINVNSSIMEDTVSFEVILNEKATGNVILSINSESYSGSLIDGKVNFTISDLTPGDYNCVIDYEGMLILIKQVLL